MSTSAIERKIAYLEVLKYKKVSSGYKNSIKHVIEGLHVDSIKNVSFMLWSPDCIFGVFCYQELSSK